jgi:hypothetical protein
MSQNGGRALPTGYFGRPRCDRYFVTRILCMVAYVNTGPACVAMNSPKRYVSTIRYSCDGGVLNCR